MHAALGVATQGGRWWFGAYLALVLLLASMIMALYATWQWAG